MSSRSWLSYSYQSRFHLTPLSYETLEYASGFASEQCPEGIVAISTNTLRYGYTLEQPKLQLHFYICAEKIFCFLLTVHDLCMPSVCDWSAVCMISGVVVVPQTELKWSSVWMMMT